MHSQTLIPDLAYSPPSSTGYLSPAESDAIQTPFLNDLDHSFHHLVVDHELRRETSTQIPNYDSKTKLAPLQIPHPASFTYDSSVDDFMSYSPSSKSSPSDSLPPSSYYRTPEIHPTERMLDACRYSEHFPEGHQLDSQFASTYQLEDQLGSGGYGFVMTAKHRRVGYEVAVKFIIKEKVPDYAWVDDERFGRLPTEVFLLDYMDHKNIAKGIDLFQDSLYYYLVSISLSCVLFLS